MARKKPPEPFKNYPEKDIFWEYEPFDRCLPEEKGFMTDYVLSTRGSGVPTMFHVWGCLTIMSALIKREAWIEWYPSKLFANLYTILIGEPGRMYKSTSVNISFKLLENIHEYMSNINMKVIKEIQIIDGKITPERLLDRLKPKVGEYELVDSEGNPIYSKKTKKIKVYPYTSEVMIIASELSSLLTKASYNEGMITNLLKLYDCDDHWSTDTFSRDKTELKNIYSTLLAACTPEQFRESIPKSVASDGFLSRTNVVYCKKNHRKYPKPKQVINGPTKEHLRKSLAWIGENIKGEYSFSDEAEEWFAKWYERYVKDLETNISQAGFKARFDIKLRQVAFLISAQRYNVTKIISLEDMRTANRILQTTFRNSVGLIHEFISTDIERLVRRIREYIKERKTVDRRTLLQNTSITAKMADIALSQLCQDGSIIIKLEGKLRVEPSKHGIEIYKYRGD
jgi:hypothetical protein